MKKKYTQKDMGIAADLTVAIVKKLMLQIQWLELELDSAKNPHKNQLIENLDFTIRTAGLLEREGIKTIGDLLEWSQWDLVHTEHMGKKSLAEINSILSGLGLSIPKRIMEK
jgi:DNA-directed RNA polymerase alpha subunit